MGAHDDPQPHEPKRTIKLEVLEDSPDTTRVLPEPPRDDYRVISSEPHDLEGADETTTLLSAPEVNQQTRVLNESSDAPRPHSETPELTGAPVANLTNQKPQRHVLEPTSVSKLRYALAILAASLSILCALTGSVASWVNQNLISQSGFNQLSTQLVEDQDFQKRIADAAVTDVMNSDAVKRVFPESGNNFLTQILSTSRGEVKKRLSENAQRLTGTSEYRTMWRQVAADTHTYNLAHPDDPAALDISAFYRELDARVGSIGIYDPDISSWGKHLISIDRDGNPVQHAVQRMQWVGSMSGALIVASIIGLVIALILLPRGRFVLLTCTFLILAAGLWILSAVMAQQTPQTLGLSTDSAVGTVFLDGLVNTARPMLTGHLNSLASYSAWAAVVSLLGGILAKLIALTASGTTVRTH
ncbi:hypothetical protein [Rothia dentocariosa]|uniref:hypothetical protein n=1 Tax=Rothia dentocariosa TaxID=2047 RepID=UPI000C7B12B9|nr:hypothetical protein [Rothia dentocariosa]PLA18570.1 hypothetical protein CYK04_03965 [Rothia dentocariosa]